MIHLKAALALAFREFERKCGAQDAIRPSTGLAPLDRLTDGMPPGSTTAFSGRSGAGVRSLCASVALNFLLNRGPVIWITRTLSSTELVNRLLAQKSEVDIASIESGRLDRSEWAKVAGAAADIADLRLQIFEDSPALPDLERLAPGDLALVVSDVPLDARQFATKTKAAVIAIRPAAALFDFEIEVERRAERVTLTTKARRNGPLHAGKLEFSTRSLRFRPGLESPALEVER